jgi:dihydroflavonol-4-reductase
MKRVLVTGATGFLGKHLVCELRNSQEELCLRLLRRRAPRCSDHEPGVEVVHGDVACADDVLRSAMGVAEIYHLAGLVSRNPKDQEILYRTHIEGTRNVCEAARCHGVGKVVVVSSSGTIAVSPQPLTHDETSDFKNETVADWPYYLSKIFAEKLALDYTRRYALPVVIANPSLLLGPGDDRQSSTGDIALFLQGQILAIPQGGLNFVDVRDAAAGLVAAMRRGKPGERYLLGGPNWTFRQLIGKVAEISGRRAPRLQPSLPWTLFGARLLRRLFPLLGKQFRLDDASVKMASLFWYCETTKARRELGFQTRDPVITLRDTVEDIRRLTARA